MIKFILFLVLNICGLVWSDVAGTSMSQKQLIIDNDAGGDDAMAIFMALLYEKHFNGPKLVGLTTVNGNTNEDNVCTNNQRILKVAKRKDVPIYRGSKKSLVTTPAVTDWFGKDGLGDNGERLDDLAPPQNQDAVSALIELSKIHEGQLSVIAIAGLTNIALAIQQDPKFLNRLSHLYVGAGHIYSEENSGAEFNAHMDVEAYHLVAQNATTDKVTFLPFSQARKSGSFSLAWRNEVLGAMETDIMKAQNSYEKISLPREERWHALDPAVVAIAVKPELVEEYKYSKHDITLSGDRRGINTNEFVNKEEANARIAFSIKTEEYRKFLLDIFAFN